MTYCVSGAVCHSKDACGGDYLKWIATTAVRSLSMIVPSTTCDVLSGPVYNLNACSMARCPPDVAVSLSLRRHVFHDLCRSGMLSNRSLRRACDGNAARF